jgi:hypothetical protein
MNGANIPQKLADAAVGATWVGWYFSHIVEINAVLQNVALVLAIIASACAIRFHSKKAK